MRNLTSLSLSQINDFLNRDLMEIHKSEPVHGLNRSSFVAMGSPELLKEINDSELGPSKAPSQ